MFEILWDPGQLEGSGEARARSGQRPVESFRLQVIDTLGAVKAEHAIVDSLTIGRSEGDIKFPLDPGLAPLNARVFVDDGQLFIKDLSNGADNIFLRVSGGYTLQSQDIILMGRQEFQFREISGAMSVAAGMGIALAEVSRTLAEPVAELHRLHPKGSVPARFPLSLDQVYFGRVKGTYTFPEDKLMSRAHARIVQRAEDFIVEDLGSRNGTFVKVRGTAPLAANGTILLGDQLLRIIPTSV